MQVQDESQQAAELRQAFLKYLPKRLEGVRKRGRRLCQSGWDVNALALLFEDVQTLAGMCGRYGQLDLGEKLFAIETMLVPLVDEFRIPESGEADAIGAAFDALTPPAPRPGAAASFGSATAQEDSQWRSPDGIALLVTPPAAFIAKFAKPVVAESVHVDAPDSTTTTYAALEGAADFNPDAAIDPSTPDTFPTIGPTLAAHSAAPNVAPTIAPAVPAKPPAEVPASARAAGTRRAYHLTDGNPLATELDQRLEQQGFQVDILEDADEVREMIRALTPNLVIVDAAFIEELDAIGQSVRLARSRASSRLVLIALANSGDVGTRLRAMRAGADSFVPLPATATEIVNRVLELDASTDDAPFRVMIIEDDRSQALFAESILRKSGMATCAVTDPLSALEALDEFDPELILMDLYMPNCDGMELTTLIRERDRFINTPIVFLSGEHDTDKRFDALSAGGDDYLEKPIRPKYLISAVTNRVRRARSLNRRVAAQNPRDPVSGLFDRAHVIDRVAEMIANSETGTNLGGLFFVIIDGAHAIRERIGLSAFDTLLGQAGALLASLVAGTDLAARYGDTSFIALAPGQAEQALLRFGEDIRARFEKHLFEIGDKSLSLAVNIGIAPFAQGFPDAAAAINAAERACALARSGTNKRVQVYEAPREPAIAGAADSLVTAINEALRQDRFQMLFQPIASLHGGGDEQFQVLLRLRGEHGRLYTAAEIVPAAEKAGVIHAVDRWVLNRCLMVLQERDRLDRPVRLFVGQSIETLFDPQRLAWLKQQVDARQVTAEHVVLEFRFADAIARVRQAAEFFEAARRVGLRISLSSFEGSAGAFQALQHLEVDYLKIAGKYVTEARGNSVELKRLVQYAAEHRILLVAPMVEDAQTAALLWTSGVDFIQGDFVQQATADLEFDFRA
jgi:diguanylate cyclase (GGDEF)-like protein